MPALLKPKHELFCVRYYQTRCGIVAAKDAGYNPSSAANQGYRLLKRPDIQARIAELRAEDEAWVNQAMADRDERLARLAALRATERDTLLSKLDPVYDALLYRGDFKEVMKVIALQAEIAGHLYADEEAPRRVRRGVRPSQNKAASDD